MPSNVIASRTTFTFTAAVVLTFSCLCSAGDDWPMWRSDATRSGASSNQLPDEVEVHWKRQFKQRVQVWDDPLNLDLMAYDRILEPIVANGKLFIGLNDHDKVIALDSGTGKQLWSAFAEGPVRLPPVASDGQVYFTSDDGFLYAVSAETGKLTWKFNGAPSTQKAIGNRRIISAWPARGGPVIRDDKVYFAASIWPFMGTFLYCLDSGTGEIDWVNGSTGAQYIKQPHSAPSFAGVAPQGALVATEHDLIVPGGRSVPAVFERETGKLRYFEINAGGKGTGGSFVTANEQFFFVHTREKGTRAFNLDDGLKTAFMPNEPVLADGIIYASEFENEKSVIRAYNAEQETLWQIDVPARGDLILAGDKLFAAEGDTITSVKLPVGDNPAAIVSQIEVDGDIQRLLAADEKLFAVSLEGTVYALGAKQSLEATTIDENDVFVKKATHSLGSDHNVEEILRVCNNDGYAFWFGNSDSPVLSAMSNSTKHVQLAVVDDNLKRITQFRTQMESANRYGRITAHHSDPKQFSAPKYVAHTVYVGNDLVLTWDADTISSVYKSVRPFGGVMYLVADKNLDDVAARVRQLQLEQAEVEVHSHGVIVRRVGALPGAGDWTHQYGNVANTIKSDDSRVKLPLGILWFGGSSNMDVLPRHGHGPPEQVVGGKLFIQGMNSLSARDVYTGRVLWKREFEDLGTYDLYFDSTYENVPLNPKYNQVHIPGANGRGTNYVVTEDRVYLVLGDACLVLDPSTGKTLSEIRLPVRTGEAKFEWGYVGVYEDVLLGGLGFADYRDRHGLSFESDKKLKASRAGFGSKSFDKSASAGLVAFDRHTGELLWRVDANHSFWHNGIVAGGGKVYCLDKNPTQIEEAMRRRGKSNPASYRIVALEAKTGKTLWEASDGIFGTWLGYSAKHDLLLQAGAQGSDRLYSEVGQGMSVLKANSGEILWKNDALKYAGPCILHNDLIITNANSYSESAGAFQILTGKQKLIKNPITGELQPWKIKRAYGCNNIIASENMLTFRSGAAGFYDLTSHGGTGNLGGFKSGCTSNLVVANGVLNAPDYTRTCSCSYQNQTSLALVHMPEVDVWSVNSLAATMPNDRQFSSLSLNFGAPGDRRDEHGKLWLEYPVVAGDSPALSVQFNEGAKVFQQHSSVMSHTKFPWIMASGVDELTDLTIQMNLRPEFQLTTTGVPIAHPDDDAEEAANGDVSLGSSDLELVLDDEENQVVGLRFENLNVGRGTEIRSAYIQFTCDEVSDDQTSLMVNVEDSADAAEFEEESHDLSRRDRGKNEVAWSPAEWKKTGESGSAQRSPNLGKLVQSVVNRPDWKSGNAMAFLFTGIGKRVAVSSKGPALESPRLIVDAELEKPNRSTTVPSRPHDIALYFARPARGSEIRVFDVYAQDKLVASDITLTSPETEDSNDIAIVRLNKIQIQDEIHLRFAPKMGSAVLSGIDITLAN